MGKSSWRCAAIRGKEIVLPSTEKLNAQRQAKVWPDGIQSRSLVMVGASVQQD
jgi:hypothetical protein